MALIPGKLMQYALDNEHYQRTSSAIEWGAMSLTPQDLAAAGQAIAGCDLVAPRSDRLVHPPAHLLAHLVRLHHAAGHLAATAPEMLMHPEVARAVEQQLVRLMVGCLTEGIIAAGNAVRHQRVPVMRRLEQVLEEKPDRPLYLAEVCARIGVPVRTLRQHCVEHLGIGPHQYLWLRRMNLAHRALTRAEPGSASVTAIANDHGFAELGRFAVAYRRLFGEPPSATLRRAAEQPKKLIPDDVLRLPILP
jgi:transcriptional regulator GlxA family with amidase domain